MTQKNPHKLKPPDQNCVMTGLKPAITQARALNREKKIITVTRFYRHFGFSLAFCGMHIYTCTHFICCLGPLPHSQMLRVTK